MVGKRTNGDMLDSHGITEETMSAVFDYVVLTHNIPNQESITLSKIDLLELILDSISAGVVMKAKIDSFRKVVN